MTIHATIQYLIYKWKAMGRHGIHSPFVYSFIEDVVQNRKNIAVDDSLAFPYLEPHYATLLARIIAYYHYKTIQLLPAGQNDNVSDCDVLVLPGKEPLLWSSQANKYFGLLKNNSCVIVIDIHQSAVHTHEWNRICANPKVLMSIDLYGIGLLFFKDEFKEKQHFVLKYWYRASSKTPDGV